MDNRSIARRLLAMAHALEERHANFHRVKAYRRAAETVLGLDRPVEDLVAGAGRRALAELPGIGGSLSEKIEKLVRIGDIPTLNDMGEDSPGIAALLPGRAISETPGNCMEPSGASRTCKRCDVSSR